MVTNLLLKLARLPGADMFLSFIGRRILSAFSLIRTAILVMGVANLLLFHYLDTAEAQERNKLAEQDKLDHLSFVLQTQIQSYESAVWQTGRLPSTISSARDLYTSEATGDLLALRKLDRALLAPGGALHDFVMSYLRLNDLWQSIIPAIERGGDTSRLRTLWTGDVALITNTPKLVSDYRRMAQQDLVALQRGKDNAKQAAVAVSLIISLISFALSIALAIVLTRQIVPPVTRLRDALQQVAQGDLSPRAHVRGKDEISELLRTFNGAIARLHSLLAAVRGHALGISEESRRLREVLPGIGPPAASLRTDDPHTRKLVPAIPDPRDRREPTVASIDQLIDQVAEMAGRASLLATSARKAASLCTEVAPRDDPAFAPLASNLQGLDAEAKQMAEQLRTLMQALQNAQSHLAESTGNLDRAAEDLRQVIEQFSLQSEAKT